MHVIITLSAIATGVLARMTDDVAPARFFCAKELPAHRRLSRRRRRKAFLSASRGGHGDLRIGGFATAICGIRQRLAVASGRAHQVERRAPAVGRRRELPAVICPAVPDNIGRDFTGGSPRTVAPLPQLDAVDGCLADAGPAFKRDWEP